MSELVLPYSGRRSDMANMLDKILGFLGVQDEYEEEEEQQ